MSDWSRVSLGIGALFSLFGVGCGHAPHAGSTMVLREGAEGIQVVGEGEAEARPDMARFEIGIVAQRPDVAAARDASAAAQTQVLDAIRAGGVAAEDVQTTNLSIQPEYEYTEGGRNFLGYTARNSVQVRVRDLDRLASIIDSAVRAGGNDVQLHGIGFELSDPEAVRAEARAEAMSRARSSAEQLARLAGVTLGDAVAIEEVPMGGGPMPMMRMALDAAPASTPIEAGTTQVQVQLRIRFAIR